MQIHFSKSAEELGADAAKLTASLINKAIREKGNARIILSTGASQFTMFTALLRENVDWKKVTMFHLDEYIGLDENHPASFIKYLKERFVSKIDIGEVHFVDISNGVAEAIESLTAELNKAQIDVGLIGIGVNGHIAFNDPPADFEIETAYKVVDLDETCRNQQLGEGWFPTLDDVPKQAVSMTVKQIMKCKTLVSAVPYAVKADAVRGTLFTGVTPDVPATIMKTHADWHLFVDSDSSAATGIRF